MLRNFLTACLIVGVGHALVYAQRSRTRERQAQMLQERLTQAQLDALSAQLNPHFRFNTLNSSAELVHHNAQASRPDAGATGAVCCVTVLSRGTRLGSGGRRIANVYGRHFGCASRDSLSGCFYGHHLTCRCCGTARSRDGWNLGVELRYRPTFAPTGNRDVGIAFRRIAIVRRFGSSREYPSSP